MMACLLPHGRKVVARRCRIHVAVVVGPHVLSVTVLEKVLARSSGVCRHRIVRDDAATEMGEVPINDIVRERLEGRHGLRCEQVRWERQELALHSSEVVVDVDSLFRALMGLKCCLVGLKGCLVGSELDEFVLDDLEFGHDQGMLMRLGGKRSELLVHSWIESSTSVVHCVNVESSFSFHT